MFHRVLILCSFCLPVCLSVYLLVSIYRRIDFVAAAAAKRHRKMLLLPELSRNVDRCFCSQRDPEVRASLPSVAVVVVANVAVDDAVLQRVCLATFVVHYRVGSSATVNKNPTAALALFGVKI